MYNIKMLYLIFTLELTSIHTIAKMFSETISRMEKRQAVPLV